jgi:hypothetical protein
MALVSEGIENVKVFELPTSIQADGEDAAAKKTALVTWRSRLEDKVYQVYANGKYAGATPDSQQREIVVQVPTSLCSAVWIEVFAVEPEEAHIDFGSNIERGSVDSGRVKITLLREQGLPPGASADVFCDNGAEQIDYDQPVNKLPIRIWPAWQDKAGFAMAEFGNGDFGFDGAAAVGFGSGSFGRGELGFDADTIEWTSEAMPAGTYRFGVKITDERGNESNTSETGPVVVTPGAKPASGLRVHSFDEQTDQLLLEIEGNMS